MARHNHHFPFCFHPPICKASPLKVAICPVKSGGYEGSFIAFKITLDHAAQAPLSLKLGFVQDNNPATHDAKISGSPTDINNAFYTSPYLCGNGSDTVLIGKGCKEITVYVYAKKDNILENNEVFGVKILSAQYQQNSYVNGPVNITQNTAFSTIFDNTKGNWNLTGNNTVNEGQSANYVLHRDFGLEGTSVNVTLKLALLTASNADLVNNQNALKQSILNAISTQTGITFISATSNGSCQWVTLKFDGNSTQNFSFSLPILLDTLKENTELYKISIDSVSRGCINNNFIQTTIMDVSNNNLDQVVWNLTGDANTTEGVSAHYVLSYSGAVLAPGQTVSINLGFVLGDTTANDFVTTFLAAIDAGLTSGISRSGNTITFNSTAANSLNINLSVADDNLFEGAENYQVNISLPSAGSISNGLVTTAIGASDQNIIWNLSGDVNVTEGNSAAYVLSYSGAVLAPGQTVSIDLNFVFGNTLANDFADTFLNAVDAGLTSGITRLGNTITFDSTAAPALSFHWDTVNDFTIEPDEHYALHINNPSAGTINNGNVDSVILANDPIQLNLFNNPTFFVEGNSAIFTFNLNQPSPVPIDFTIQFINDNDLNTQDATLLGPDTDTDFSNLTLFDLTQNTSSSIGTTFTIAAGSTDFQLAVPLIAHDGIEGFERFGMQITSATNNGVSNLPQPVINNNTAFNDISDNGVTVWNVEGAPSIAEGGSAFYLISFFNSLSFLTLGNSVSIDFSFNPLATDGSDFTQNIFDAIDTSIANSGFTGIVRTGNTIAFTNTGATPPQLAIFLPSLADNVQEIAEDFQFQIQSPSEGVIYHDTVTTTLNDGFIYVSLDRLAGGEANLEGNFFNYQLSLNAASNVDTVVTVNFFDNTFTQTLSTGEIISYPNAITSGPQAEVAGFYGAPDLLSPQGNTFIIPAGSTSVPFYVFVPTDSLFESSEFFNIHITDVQTIGVPFANTVAGLQSSALSAIFDNNNIQWSLISSAATITEGDSVTYTLSYAGTLPVGQSISTAIDLLAFSASPADLSNDLFTAIDNGLLSGISRVGGIITFDDTAPNSFQFTLNTVQDGLMEGGESLQLFLLPFFGTAPNGFTNTYIVDPDAPIFTFTGDLSVQEGNAANYSISYSNAVLNSGDTLTIDLFFNPQATLAEDFSQAFVDSMTTAVNATTGMTVFGNNQFVSLTFSDTAPSTFNFSLPTAIDLLSEGTEAYHILASPQSISSILNNSITTTIME